MNTWEREAWRHHAAVAIAAACPSVYRRVAFYQHAVIIGVGSPP
ncbi:hypothetical protein SAMN05661093_01133 [Kibdelosporangium aridum]|uniref:Uncharacterized protein n=1 Tax=Kibdelosporangium aridum TaxID=2030 RepID=A0A1W2AUU3_KIBAR|nr:hypothetical protein SAMN05661093_01133 [Kibdelosporangium aridum]